MPIISVLRTDAGAMGRADSPAMEVLGSCAQAVPAAALPMRIGRRRAVAGLTPRHAARAALALLSLQVVACALPAAGDERLHQALMGTWCNPHDSGTGCWAWDEFKSDGTLQMCGRHDGEADGFFASALVSFEGRRMCYQVQRATSNFWLRPGQRYCTEIVEVGADSHVYRDVDTGARFTLRRWPAEGPSCIAKLQAGGGR